MRESVPQFIADFAADDGVKPRFVRHPPDSDSLQRERRVACFYRHRATTERVVPAGREGASAKVPLGLERVLPPFVDREKAKPFRRR